VGILQNYGSEGTALLQACLSEFRVVIGIAEWTSNFEPPTVPYSNAAEVTQDACMALWHFDTDFSDAGPYGVNFRAVGAATISESAAKFGAGGLSSPAEGVSDYLIMDGTASPYTAIQANGIWPQEIDLSGPFTLEGWVTFGTGATQAIGPGSLLGEGGYLFLLGIAIEGGSLQWYNGEYGINDSRLGFTDLATPTDGLYHHVAFTRDCEGVLRCFLDGVVSSNTYTTSEMSSPDPSWFGDAGGANPGSTAPTSRQLCPMTFNGSAFGSAGSKYADEWLISRTCRYNANFTPTGPFARPIPFTNF
jgi:hypothetical protein